MVAQGRSAELYTGADDGKNAPKVIAGPGTPIYEAVREYRLRGLGFYIYPPLLADLLVPLAHLGLFQAWKVWLTFNGLLLLGTGYGLTRLLGLRLLSVGAGVLMLALLCFAPVMHCLAVGQVTILLLFLWCWGILLDQEDHELSSAAVFAFAAAIKLTPALVLVPFLLWRRRRWAGCFLAVFAALLTLCAVWNTPHSLHVFFTRVTPGMANAIPDTLNFSIAAMTERLMMALHGGAYDKLLDTPSTFDHPFFEGLPHSIFLAGKAVSTLFLISILGLLTRRRQRAHRGERMLVLSIFGFVSAIVSPVSWLNAYAVAFLAFAVLWYEVLTIPTSWFYLLSLTYVSLLLGSPMLTGTTIYLVRQGHFLSAATLGTFSIAAAGGLLLCRLQRIPGSFSRAQV